MSTVDYIKSEINRLYEAKQTIHISVKMTRPKITVESMPAVITGVYKNIFQIEGSDSRHPNRHTFQYADVLIGQVVIEEVDYIPTVSILNKK